MPISTINDLVIKDRESLCNWIERQFGAPLIRVELTQEMLEDAIDEATQEYTKYVTPEENFMVLDSTMKVEDIPNNFDGYKLPDNIVGVNGVTSQRALRNFAMQLDPGMSRSTAFGLSGGISSTGTPGFLTSFHMTMSHIDLLERMAGGDFQFRYNNANQELQIYPELKPHEKVIVLGQEYREEQFVYGEKWVKEYSKACAGIMLGMVRGKHESVTLLGGSSISATASNFIDKFEARKRELEEEILKREYQVLQFYTM